jgi:mono/diheme cytochrome c family protein
MRALCSSSASRTLFSVRDLLLPLFVLAVAVSLFAAAGDGAWLKRVPEKDRTRANPMASHADAVAGGSKLYQQNCSKCHGEDGQGVNGKPSLRSERVHNATPGELEWLLRNGSLKNGMPSWSSLPEPQRWQIVTYLRTLP